jgi:hypothetical protein
MSADGFATLAGLERLGRLLNGFDDVDIPGAATEVPDQGVADLIFRRVGVLLQ